MRSLEGLRIGPNEGSCGAAAYTGATVAVENILTHPNWQKYKVLAEPHGLRACWSTPIKSPRGEVLGTFAMYYRESRLPSEQERAYVKAAMHIAALAIAQQREHRELEHSRDRAEQLARLYSVSSRVNEAIARESDPQQLYASACRITVEQGLARLAWVGVYDSANNRVEMAAHFGEPQDYIEMMASKLKEPGPRRGPGAAALLLGQPSVVNDIETDPKFGGAEAALSRGLRSCAAFPLRVGSSVSGVLGIYSQRSGFFQTEEVEVFTALAESIAHAVVSSENAEKLREREELMRIAGRTAKIGAWTMSLSPLKVLWSDEVRAIYELEPMESPSFDASMQSYAPEYREPLRRAVEDCARDGVPFDIEAQLITRREKRVWVRIVGQAARDTAGVITRVQGSMQDVSERHRL
jgi:GAF domain-containing protein